MNKLKVDPKSCIFEIYFEGGKDCDRKYNCEGCQVRNAMKRQVEIIMKSKSLDTEVA